MHEIIYYMKTNKSNNNNFKGFQSYWNQMGNICKKKKKVDHERPIKRALTREATMIRIRSLDEMEKLADNGDL